MAVPHDKPLESTKGIEPLNEVRLRGRWTAASVRELPSGDELVSARVVVQREGAGVDTIDCAVWTPALRRRSLAIPEGTCVEVDGSLRRRFWRTPAGAASRYEVEVSGLRRVPAAASPAGRRPVKGAAGTAG
ncbi:MAG TPA: hypothetical protein VF661_03480 [Actinomycetales bacterium]|jgi:single-strand DNA-binding protein